MGAEMRKARRTDIDVTVSLNQLGVNAADRIQNKADVHIVDISKGGIAFKSGYDFKVNSFYDTVITLANGEKLYVVVEILHRDSCENDEYMYGCRFVGIGAEDQFKIEAYQIVDTGSAI
ncbi:MAG: PilZ domain-containing protein [Lachnospira pectinoschiza]